MPADIIEDSYLSMLETLAQPHGATATAEAAGVSRETIYRANKAHEAHSIGAVFAKREGVAKLVGREVPPPIVAIRDQNDFDWLQAGRRLRAADDKTFTRALAKLMEATAGAEKLRGFMDLLDPSESDDDDTTDG